MSGSPIDWHGLLDGLFVISFVVSVPLAVPLLFLVRMSVRRFMRQRAGAVAASDAESAPAVAGPVSPLQLVTESAPKKPATGEGRALLARMQSARRTAAVLYAIAGVAAALVLAAGGGKGAYVWPAVLIVATVAVPAARLRIIGLTVVYLVLFTAIPSFALYTFAPTLLLLLAANRWTKTITLVMALVAFALFGAMGGAMVVLERFGEMGWLAAFVVLFALDLYLVHLLVRAYERKLFSDASYQFAFIWIIFIPWWLYQDRVLWRVCAAFALYAVIARIGLLVLQRRARRQTPASLLVLRVFGAPGRSQRLFEQLGTRWRYAGPLHLIAGADSAVANLDLAEAIRYLTFRFRSLYVADAADLDRRLARLDVEPDPDGRYRTNDFFCFEDTWKPTFTRLLERSNAVMVDLSGFNVRNAGVAFELGHLLQRRPLDSFVLVTDDRTDLRHLHATLGELWSRVGADSPNARLVAPAVRLLHKPSPRALVAALCDAAVAGTGTIPPCSNTST